MANARWLIVCHARGRLPILLLGERGTGKELAARAVHQLSPRAHKPFIPINCAALVETLFESELFGHKDGAFTGANGQRLGRLRSAHGGVVFLDEIGDLALAMQIKLLRAIEYGEITPVGEDLPVAVNVRIVAATNQDMGKLRSKGHFRADLRDRLNGVSIRLPALREHREDISIYVPHFLRLHAEELAAEKLGGEKRAVEPKRVTDGALNILSEAEWPGNVRELKRALERAAESTTREVLTPEDILTSLESDPEKMSATGQGVASEATPDKTRIIRTLEETHWDMAEAARRLSIGRSTLYDQLKALGIETKKSRRRRK